MIARKAYTGAALCLGSLLASPAYAGAGQESAPPPIEAAPAPAPTPAPKAPTVDVSGAWTQFVGAAVAGDGNGSLRYGGRFDLYATIPSGALGLGNRFTINIHPEFVYGKNTNNIGGNSLLPVNTALLLPSNGAEDFDLSLNMTVKLGAKASVTFGKVNLLDLVPKTPLIGGGGIEGYQNIALAAPPSGLVPPSLFGAMLSIPTEKAIFGLWVYDPVSATNRTGFEDPFGSGVTILGSVTVPVKIGGKLGFQNLKIAVNTKRGIDLRDVPELLLPPGTTIISNKKGGWNITYSFQQYLWQSSKVRGNGWGIYGQIGRSDGNPTPLEWSGLIGIGGNISDARPADKFGFAYFRQSFSDALANALLPVIRLHDEQGVEAFYTMQIGKALRLTFDAQIVDPAQSRKSTAVILGIRARAGF